MANQYLTIRLFLLLVAIALFWQVASNGSCQFAVQRSTTPDRIATQPYPTQLPVFLPGNSGLPLMSDTTNSAAIAIPYPAELKCDGNVILIASPDYEVSPFADDAASTSPRSFFSRLGSGLSGLAFEGDVADLRLDKYFAGLLEKATREQTERFWKSLSRICSSVYLPMFSVDVESSETAIRLATSLRQSVPRALVGRCLTGVDPAPDEARGFDFVIVRPSAAPWRYREQAAVSYYRRQFPGKIIFFELERPQLYASLFWLATGCAGIYHDDLRADAGERESLRALGFLHMLLYGPGLQLASGLDQHGVAGVLGNPQLLCVALGIEPGATLAFPTSASRPAFNDAWYCPGTGQLIVGPVRLPPDTPLLNARDMPPRGNWVYVHITLPYSNESTTPDVTRMTDFGE